MEKFMLRENEKLIGSGMMAYKHKKSPVSQPTRGTIYVTTKRVCYYESWTGYVYMDLPLSEAAGYDAKRALFVTFVYIYGKDNTEYIFSGFPAKKLLNWLKQAGMKKLARR